MKNGKIIIEIPAGVSDAERKRILMKVDGILNKSTPKRRLDEAEEVLRNAVWPEDLEEVLNGFQK